MPDTRHCRQALCCGEQFRKTSNQNIIFNKYSILVGWVFLWMYYKYSILVGWVFLWMCYKYSILVGWVFLWMYYNYSILVRWVFLWMYYKYSILVSWVFLWMYSLFFGKKMSSFSVTLEMPVPSQGHYGFHTFPVVDWFCLFIYLYEFWLSLCKIILSSVILLLPLFTQFTVLKLRVIAPFWRYQSWHP
jgi:hypothetical protein